MATSKSRLWCDQPVCFLRRLRIFCSFIPSRRVTVNTLMGRARHDERIISSHIVEQTFSALTFHHTKISYENTVSTRNLMLREKGVQVERCEEIDNRQVATINSPRREQGNSDKNGYCSGWSWAQASSPSTRRRTFHKRIQCIQSKYYFRRRSSGACPAFAWLGSQRCPLPRRPRGEGEVWTFLAAFLSCVSRRVHLLLSPLEGS
jgi:hypothetical protein